MHYARFDENSVLTKKHKRYLIVSLKKQFFAFIIEDRVEERLKKNVEERQKIVERIIYIRKIKKYERISNTRKNDFMFSSLKWKLPILAE